MTKAVFHPDYPAFLDALKKRILYSRTSAARAVNRELVLLYWDIGRAIVEKQQIAGWGDSVVERLAADLRGSFSDMRGFSADNLWRMRQFFTEYSGSEFLEQAVPELKKARRQIPAQAVQEIVSPKASHAQVRQEDILERPVPELAAKPAFGKNPELLSQTVRELVACVPWGHHVDLLKKIKSPVARLYYLRATAQLGWSRSVLLNQIKAGAYERAVKEKKTHNFALALPEHFAEQADEMMKSRYNLEFLGIGRAMKERELEDRLIERLQQFLLELGYGFCFVGRQYRLALGRKEYFVDLLFYHRFLKALVAFDLKIGSFEPEHAGKMDFYLNVLNEKERGPDDQPAIGIILCAEKEDVEVEFALKTKNNPIGVAEYQLQARLPAEFKGRLPTAKQLANAVRGVLPPRR
jgi:predicted nuclease of restriction endonuclease-like (RecB) superfamily